jgi:4-diphosphocytidyl-2-C-methyl-D-erythritol kinase
MSEPVVERAHAKINVFLRVLGRRGDGYHDIETVLLPLDLHDVITVTHGKRFEIEITGARAADLTEAGGDTLLRAAAEAFARATVTELPSVHVTLDKRIPVAAGMGGGSADAAALLRVLGRLHAVPMGRLREIAAEVGSDVPGLVSGAASYASGRGEHVVPVHAQTTTWVVHPFAFAVATPDAYRWWDDAPVTGPDHGALIAALETGNDELLGSALYDDLQPGVVARHPEVVDAIDAFVEAGALGAVMTGSGPTVVALARHLSHADALAAAVPGSFVVTGPPRTMNA